MGFRSDNFAFEQMHKEHEETMQDHFHLEGGRRAVVRQIATKVFGDCGCQNNAIYYVLLDNHTWQIDYNGKMPFGDKPVIEDLIQEQLQLAFPNEGPYAVKLVGLGYHPR